MVVVFYNIRWRLLKSIEIYCFFSPPPPSFGIDFRKFLKKPSKIPIDFCRFSWFQGGYPCFPLKSDLFWSFFKDLGPDPRPKNRFYKGPRHWTPAFWGRNRRFLMKSDPQNPIWGMVHSLVFWPPLTRVFAVFHNEMAQNPDSAHVLFIENSLSNTLFSCFYACCLYMYSHRLVHCIAQQISTQKYIVAPLALKTDAWS